MEGNSRVIIIPTLPPRKKEILEAYIIAVPGGLIGAHHYYLRNYKRAIIYTFTLGLFGIGWLTDLLRMAILVKRANRNIENPGNIESKLKYVSDAYVFWFPLGLLGFHQYYLRRWGWGIAYSLTLGLLGIGWILDGFRMYRLVKKYNKDLTERLANTPVYKEKQLLDAYVIAITPAGIIGMHHFYLGRYSWGFLYLFTLGLFGLGWLSDLIRLPKLVERTNEMRRSKPEVKLKYIDEAYTLLVPPVGLFGLHHYYLRRYLWGVAYTLTLGYVGIGWITDWFRIPSLVEQVNARAKQKKSIRDILQSYVDNEQGLTNNNSNNQTEQNQPEMEPPPSYEMAISSSTTERQDPPPPSPRIPPLRPPPPRNVPSRSSPAGNLAELGGFQNVAMEQKRMVAEAHQRAAAEESRESSLGGFEAVAMEQKLMVEEAHQRQAQLESINVRC